MSNFVAHIFTPETDKTSHYWFSVCNSLEMGEEGRTRAEEFVTGLTQPFTHEDLPMLEQQQSMIGDADFWSLKPVLLPGDAGAVRARRVLDKLTAEEQTGTHA